MRWWIPVLPISAVVAASWVGRAVGVFLPSEDLRLAYMTLLVGFLLAACAIGRRRGAAPPFGYGVALAALVAFEMSVPLLQLYDRFPRVNRLEHLFAFGAFAWGVRWLVGLFAGDGARVRAATFVFVFAVGVGHEVFEYLLDPRRRSLDAESVRDVLVNTVALVAVLAPRWRRESER